MNIVKKLLVVLTTMSVLVFVPAKIVAPVQNPHIAALTHSASDFTTVGSTGHSFADIVNLPALTDAATTYMARVNLADISNVADSASTQSGGASATESLGSSVSTLNDEVSDDVSAVADPDDSSKSQSGTSSWHTDAGFLFSIAEVPEPADWMTLLCGLVVVAFMARRKNGPFAD